MATNDWCITCSCSVSGRSKRKIVGDNQCDSETDKRYCIGAEEVQIKEFKNIVLKLK